LRITIAWPFCISPAATATAAGARELIIITGLSPPSYFNSACSTLPSCLTGVVVAAAFRAVDETKKAPRSSVGASSRGTSVNRPALAASAASISPPNSSGRPTLRSRRCR
jgi:hypothetical protein